MFICSTTNIRAYHSQRRKHLPPGLLQRKDADFCDLAVGIMNLMFDNIISFGLLKISP
jgi:hypothetical protein